jgi:hypothetical protein
MICFLFLFPELLLYSATVISRSLGCGTGTAQSGTVWVPAFERNVLGQSSGQETVDCPPIGLHEYMTRTGSPHQNQGVVRRRTTAVWCMHLATRIKWCQTARGPPVRCVRLSGQRQGTVPVTTCRRLGAPRASRVAPRSTKLRHFDSQSRHVTSPCVIVSIPPRTEMAPANRNPGGCNRLGNICHWGGCPIVWDWCLRLRRVAGGVTFWRGCEP